MNAQNIFIRRIKILFFKVLHLKLLLKKLTLAYGQEKNHKPQNENNKCKTLFTNFSSCSNHFEISGRILLF